MRRVSAPLGEGAQWLHRVGRVPLGAAGVWVGGRSKGSALVPRPRVNLRFPDDMGCGASFHALTCHLFLSLGEASVKIFGPSPWDCLLSHGVVGFHCGVLKALCTFQITGVL